MQEDKTVLTDKDKADIQDLLGNGFSEQSIIDWFVDDGYRPSVIRAYLDEHAAVAKAQPAVAPAPPQNGVVQNREGIFTDVVLWSLDHDYIGIKMPNGDPVTIVDTSGDEFKVVWRGQESWVKKHHIQTSEYTVPVVGGFHKGDTVTILDDAGDHWYPNGVVLEVFPVDSKYNGFDIPAGTILVEYELGTRYVFEDKIEANVQHQVHDRLLPAHDFEQHTFDKPTSCAKCEKFLWGLRSQGQRCKSCKEARCHACAEKRDACETKVASSMQLHSALESRRIIDIQHALAVANRTGIERAIIDDAERQLADVEKADYPVGFWEYACDDGRFVSYTRIESKKLDVERERVSEFTMCVGPSKLHVRVSFEVDEPGGSIKRGVQTSLTTGRTRDIRREASAKELAEKARSVMEECRQEAPGVGLSPYTEAESVLEIIRRETEPVKLLRGSWISKYVGVEGKLRGLPRRQDLEQSIANEAFLAPSEVVTKKILDGSFDISFNIISISYCWRARDHPDADGKQLRAIESKLKEERARFGWFFLEFNMNYGIFWDFCSLHQKDKNGCRTEKEWRQFNEALSSMDIWYMHALIMTFIVNGSLIRDLGINYEDRGWTHFERSCAELIKPANAGGEPMCRPMITEFEGSGRKLPLSPELFAEHLAQRRSTSRGDKEMVVTLYTKACMLALRGAKTISLHGIKLKNHDDEQVASVLQHCSCVKLLTLTNMDMDDAGASAIAEALPRMLNVLLIDLDRNKIGDAGAQAIAEALPRMPNLRMLSLLGNKIGDTGAQAIAEALPRMPTFSRLHLTGNKIGDTGALALAEALPKCRCMEALFCSDNTLTEVGKSALRQAWVNGGLPNGPFNGVYLVGDPHQVFWGILY